MALDFTSLAKDGEDFELLCRDVLESRGIDILSHPSRGPDGKKDILISISQKNLLDVSEKTIFLVQCKHYAHSGKSVLEKELGDFRSACLRHGADGYFLITSSIPSVTVAENLEVENKKGNLKTVIWDHAKLEEAILKSKDADIIIKKYNLNKKNETSFERIEYILASETHLPFELCDRIDNEITKGFIYKRLNYNDRFEPIDFKIGFFCAPANPLTLKSKYQLNETYVISENPKNKEEISTRNFYLKIQNYRDSTYQKLALDLIKTSPENPSIIVILNHFFNAMPYNATKETKDWIIDLISTIAPNTENQALITQELLKLCVKFRILESKGPILDLILHISKYPMPEPTNSILTYSSIRAYKDISNLAPFKDPFKHLKELFYETRNISLKISILTILKKNIMKMEEVDIESHFQSKDIKNLPEQGHAIHFNSMKIKILKNHAPYTLARLWKDYLN